MLLTPPSNTYQWLIQGVVFLFFAIRSYRNYKQTNTDLSLAMSAVFVFASVSSFLLFIPFMFTTDTFFLSHWLPLSDLIAHICYLWIGRVAWLLLLRGRVPFKLFFSLFAGLVIAAYVVVVLEYLPDGVQVIDGALQFTNVTQLGSTLYSAMLSILIPIGLYLIFQIKNASNTRAKIRTLTMGVMFAGLGFVYVFTPVYQYQPESSSILVSVFSVAIFAGSLAIWFVGRRASPENDSDK